MDTYNVVKALSKAGLRYDDYVEISCSVEFDKVKRFLELYRIEEVENRLYDLALEGDVNAMKFIVANRKDEYKKNKDKEDYTAINVNSLLNGEY